MNSTVICTGTEIVRRENGDYEVIGSYVDTTTGVTARRTIAKIDVNIDLSLIAILSEPKDYKSAISLFKVNILPDSDTNDWKVQVYKK